MKEFNLLLLGDAGVGKTTYMNRLKTGVFNTHYIPTINIEEHTLIYNTTAGIIQFNIIDGQNINKTAKVIDGCILMFAIDSLSSYNNIKYWYDIIDNNIPIILVGNKCEIKNPSVKPTHITFHRKYNILRYYYLSVKSNFNFDKPILHLARKLMDDDTLIFTPM